MENELDRMYLQTLADLARKTLGNDVTLYTVDGNDEGMLKRGSLPGIYK